ncbi:MAG TPA: hypothetical protein VFI37_08560 [Gaiellaceae bacterium]|jgi:hypothetical protein|nr:hypothetical protein [Gaiellaceae bacterium]
MRRILAWLAGALGLAGAYRALKGQPEELPADGPDPRAEELRRRLEEAKPAVDDREEFEAGETPVDAAPDPPPAPAPADPEARRREVHDRARAAIDEMRDEGS